MVALAIWLGLDALFAVLMLAHEPRQHTVFKPRQDTSHGVMQGDFVGQLHDNTSNRGAR